MLFIEGKNKDQETPLHFACQFCHLPIVEYLVEKDANIEAKDEDKRTPLHCTCEQCHLLIVG